MTEKGKKKKNDGKKDQWAIIELMGHIRVAGKLSEEERFGVKMGRIDIPIGPKKFVTQWFGGSAVFRITPATEVIARAVAAANVPAPVHSWEMPKQLPAGREVHQDLDENQIPF